MSAMDWAMGLTLYFVVTGVVVGLFSAAGAFSANEYAYANNAQLHVTPMNSSTVLPSGVFSAFSIGKLLKDLFSFFVFNISIQTDDGNLVQYMWLIRLFLVQLPLVALGFTIYYSFPTVSGGSG